MSIQSALCEITLHLRNRKYFSCLSILYNNQDAMSILIGCCPWSIRDSYKLTFFLSFFVPPKSYARTSINLLNFYCIKYHITCSRKSVLFETFNWHPFYWLVFIISKTMIIHGEQISRQRTIRYLDMEFVVNPKINNYLQ